MTIPDKFLAFAFPDTSWNGPITQAGGETLYTLTSEERNFKSDITTITRPDESTVAAIHWGSVIGLKRRSVVLANATIPAKEYLTEGGENSLHGRHAQIFRDLEGNEYYWKHKECWEPKKKTLIAYYNPPDPNRAMGARLWVHPDYCSPSLFEPLIITSLLMMRSKKKLSPSPPRTRTDASPSRTSDKASSSPRHGATSSYVGAYAFAGGVAANDGGAIGGSYDSGGGYGSG
ncbi:hypothetical protein FRC01_012652, partial [Tulasnella sp. 417]